MRLISRRCEVCGARLGQFDRTCKICHPHDGVTRLSRWQPRKGDLAARFDLGRPEQTLGAGLIVERGQAAVLAFPAGRSATLQPGPYRFDDSTLSDLALLGSAQPALTFVVTADVSLKVNFDGLLSADHLPISGEGTIAVRVARPAVFVAAVVRHQVRCTELDLCHALAQPMTDAMADFIAHASAFELDSSLAVRQKLAAVLEHRVDLTLDAQGLEFVALKAVTFRQAGIEQERRELGDVLLAERELEVLKRRIAAWEQMSDLAARLAAAEARHQQQLHELRRSLEVRTQDQDLIRRHMREKMEVQHRIELATMKASSPAELPADPPPAFALPHDLRRAAAAYTPLPPTHAESGSLA